MGRGSAEAHGDDGQQGRALDESDAPTPGDMKSDDVDGGAKKRKLAAGRGVSNLTPEQLAKKRANGTCV